MRRVSAVDLPRSAKQIPHRGRQASSNPNQPGKTQSKRAAQSAASLAANQAVTDVDENRRSAIAMAQHIANPVDTSVTTPQYTRPKGYKSQSAKAAATRHFAKSDEETRRLNRQHQHERAVAQWHTALNKLIRFKNNGFDTATLGQHKWELRFRIPSHRHERLHTLRDNVQFMTPAKIAKECHKAIWELENSRPQWDGKVDDKCNVDLRLFTEAVSNRFVVTKHGSRLVASIPAEGKYWFTNQKLFETGIKGHALGFSDETGVYLIPNRATFHALGETSNTHDDDTTYNTKEIRTKHHNGVTMAARQAMRDDHYDLICYLAQLTSTKGGTPKFADWQKNKDAIFDSNKHSAAKLSVCPSKAFVAAYRAWEARGEEVRGPRHTKATVNRGAKETINVKRSIKRTDETIPRFAAFGQRTACQLAIAREREERAELDKKAARRDRQAAESQRLRIQHEEASATASLYNELFFAPLRRASALTKQRAARNLVGTLRPLNAFEDTSSTDSFVGPASFFSPVFWKELGWAYILPTLLAPFLEETAKGYVSDFFGKSAALGFCVFLSTWETLRYQESVPVAAARMLLHTSCLTLGRHWGLGLHLLWNLNSIVMMKGLTDTYTTVTSFASHYCRGALMPGSIFNAIHGPDVWNKFSIMDSPAYNAARMTSAARVFTFLLGAILEESVKAAITKICGRHWTYLACAALSAFETYNHGEHLEVASVRFMTHTVGVLGLKYGLAAHLLFNAISATTRAFAPAMMTHAVHTRTNSDASIRRLTPDQLPSAAPADSQTPPPTYAEAVATSAVTIRPAVSQAAAQHKAVMNERKIRAADMQNITASAQEQRRKTNQQRNARNKEQRNQAIARAAVGQSTAAALVAHTAPERDAAREIRADKPDPATAAKQEKAAADIAKSLELEAHYNNVAQLRTLAPCDLTLSHFYYNSRGKEHIQRLANSLGVNPGTQSVSELFAATTDRDLLNEMRNSTYMVIPGYKGYSAKFTVLSEWMDNRVLQPLKRAEQNPNLQPAIFARVQVEIKQTIWSWMFDTSSSEGYFFGKKLPDTIMALGNKEHVVNMTLLSDLATAPTQMDFDTELAVIDGMVCGSRVNFNPAAASTISTAFFTALWRHLLKGEASGANQSTYTDTSLEVRRLLLLTSLTVPCGYLCRKIARS